LWARRNHFSGAGADGFENRFVIDKKVLESCCVVKGKSVVKPNWEGVEERRKWRVVAPQNTDSGHREHQSEGGITVDDRCFPEVLYIAALQKGIAEELSKTPRLQDCSGIGRVQVANFMQLVEKSAWVLRVLLDKTEDEILVGFNGGLGGTVDEARKVHKVSCDLSGP
jgi:hypothetical protein